MGSISDDTQLTLCTCECITAKKGVYPADLAKSFLEWYQRGTLTGLGSSTTKALRDLQMGAPWYLSGATGERSAGNGAAMRSAVLGFVLDADDPLSLTTLREVSSITHRNDEAVVGALAMVESVWHLLRGGHPEELLDRLPDKLPDTRVRDRILALRDHRDDSIEFVAAKYGSSGQAADSVPFAIFSGAKVKSLGLELLIDQVIRAGGDTDTNAAMAAQLAGTAVGKAEAMILKIAQAPNFEKIRTITESFAAFCATRSTIDGAD